MDSRTSPAGRRYMVRFTLAMIGYAVVLFGVTFWVRGAAAPTGALLYAAAAAPAVPLLGLIWAMGRYLVEETDEYLRARLVEAILWATGVTLAATTVWGFLESYARAPHAPAYGVFILFCGVLGLVQCARRLAGRA
jgi:hypothetical protein